jgi:hypothetical protein
MKGRMTLVGSDYVLVPLINGMIMDEYWLDLDCAEKKVFRDAVIDVK